MIRLLSTTSITLIIGNFTFCLFSADSGQREVCLKLLILLLDTFFPFKSETRTLHLNCCLAALEISLKPVQNHLYRLLFILYLTTTTTIYSLNSSYLLKHEYNT